MMDSSIHNFEGDPQDEAAWQAFVAENTLSSATGQKRASAQAHVQNAIYESFLLFVILVACLGTVFWQRNAAQVMALQTEVHTLQEKVSSAEAQLKTSVPDAAVTKPALQPPLVRIVETDYLRFIVEQDNFAFVIPLVATVDAEYRQISSDLGVEPMPMGEKLNVYLSDEPVDRLSAPYAELHGIFINRLTDAPQPGEDSGNSAMHHFYQPLMTELTRRQLTQAFSNRTIPVRWNALAGSLYQCALQSQPPKPVTQLRPDELQRRYDAQACQPGMVELPFEPGNRLFINAYMKSPEVADPLAEYIVATYGRAAIPMLLDVLARCDDWSQVPPKAFAISADQFTEEWHAYLAQHYPRASAE